MVVLPHQKFHFIEFSFLHQTIAIMHHISFQQKWIYDEKQLTSKIGVDWNFSVWVLASFRFEKKLRKPNKPLKRFECLREMVYDACVTLVCTQSTSKCAYNWYCMGQVQRTHTNFFKFYTLVCSDALVFDFIFVCIQIG